MNDPRPLRHPARANSPEGTHSWHEGIPESRRFYEVLLEHLDRREAIAVATVVGVRGSASARIGSKAILSLDGRNRIGWVGGGCAESFVIQQAQEAIRLGLPRRIDVDLNDAAFGVGMPCGGHLEVFIEPLNPPKRLLILGDDPAASWLARWAGCLGLHVATDPAALDPEDADHLVLLGEPPVAPTGTVEQPGRIVAGLAIGARTAAETAVSLAASLLLRETAATGRPMSPSVGIAPSGRAIAPGTGSRPQLVILGHNRITEHLAALGTSMDWAVTVNSPGAAADAYPGAVCRILDDDAYALEEVGPGCLVVIATQHKGDHLILQAIADRQPAYVGVVASRTRAALLRDFLRDDPRSHAIRDRLHAPCGLDLGARSPFEIALAIVCELIGELRQAGEHPP